MSGIKRFSGLSSREVPFRNFIMNGDMSVAQRATSVASITTSGYYSVDRWSIGLVTLGTWTMAQATTTADYPASEGFASSLKLTATTAKASLSAGDYALLSHKIEGQNLQVLKYGSSFGEYLTLSFWVKSNVTGTYIAEFVKNDGSVAKFRSVSYTINSANVWEKKVISVPPDSASGITNSNNYGIELVFWLGAGSTYNGGTLNTGTWNAAPANNTRATGQVNVAATVSNYFQITGVQLEKGSSATDFEYIPYYENLRRCQRYFYRFEGSSTAGAYSGVSTTGFGSGSTIARASIMLPVPMRRTVVTADLSFNAGALTAYASTGGLVVVNSLTVYGVGNQFISLDAALASAVSGVVSILTTQANATGLRISTDL